MSKSNVDLPQLILRRIDHAGSWRRCRSPSYSRPRASRCARRSRPRPGISSRQRLALVVDDEIAGALPAGLAEKLRCLRQAACGRARSRPRPAASPPRRMPRPEAGRAAARAGQALQATAALRRDSPIARSTNASARRSRRRRLRLVHSKSKHSAIAWRTRGSRKLLAPLVDGDRLHRGHCLAGELALDDLARVERRKIVTGRPDARGEFLAGRVISPFLKASKPACRSR